MLVIFGAFFFAFSSGPLAGQVQPVPPVTLAQNFPNISRENVLKPRRGTDIAAPDREEILVQAVSQETEGPVYKLRGLAEIETPEYLLRADEIDYNEDTGDADARGNVRFRRFQSGEELEADRVEYNLTAGTGKFFNVRGSTPAKIEARPGVLTTSSPFSFAGRWAQRIENRYILYDGIITNCKLPNPWWTLRGPRFDIVPNQRALAYQAVFRLRKVPLFYTPFFYKSLERFPRKSGFLTPNIGNSNRRGQMVGWGYYWAMSRSYDLLYRQQYFSFRGFAHMVDFRGKPRVGSDFNLMIYGVNDRGRDRGDGVLVKEGGYLMNFVGKTELPWGFSGKANFNYLSSFTFRQAFSESFNEAIFSEVNSIGFATKHWSTYGVNIAIQRNENYQSDRQGDKITIQKLPQFEFLSRERPLVRRGPLPLYLSFDSSIGLVERNQPGFDSSRFVTRIDVQPRLTTALRWKGFHLIPSFAVRETHYAARLIGDRINGQNLLRDSNEVSVDLIAPSLQRIFTIRDWKWLGDKVKHVIEPRLRFRHVAGITDFNRIIRFDEIELLSNTTEAEVSITNRFYTKRKDGQVWEALSWFVAQQRYFDPTFGGALLEGRRNVVASQLRLTPFAFLDRPRDYSPVVSVLRTQPTPGTGIEWRADYDPLRQRLVNSSITADSRVGKYFVSLGHTQLRSATQLSPNTNQFRSFVGYGQENQRGWSTGFLLMYDFREGVMQFANTQVTYNTDCCGFSIQYRRFSFGTRNENQFRVAFAVANIGSFGTLRRQERMF